MKCIGLLAFLLVSANAAATKQSSSLSSPGSLVHPGGTSSGSTVNSFGRPGTSSVSSTNPILRPGSSVNSVVSPGPSYPSQSGFDLVPGYYYLYPVQQNYAAQEQLGYRGMRAVHKTVVDGNKHVDPKLEHSRAAEVTVVTGTTSTNPIVSPGLVKRDTSKFVDAGSKKFGPKTTRAAEVTVVTGSTSTGTGPIVPPVLFKRNLATTAVSDTKKTKVSRQIGYAGYRPETGVFAVYYPTFGGPVQTYPVQSHPEGPVQTYPLQSHSEGPVVV